MCEVPKCLFWRTLRHHCPMYTVSCIFFNKCLIFHITRPDTFWIDFVFLKLNKSFDTGPEAKVPLFNIICNMTEKDLCTRMVITDLCVLTFRTWKFHVQLSSVYNHVAKPSWDCIWLDWSTLWEQIPDRCHLHPYWLCISLHTPMCNRISASKGIISCLKSYRAHCPCEQLQRGLERIHFANTIE